MPARKVRLIELFAITAGLIPGIRSTRSNEPAVPVKAVGRSSATLAGDAGESGENSEPCFERAAKSPGNFGAAGEAAPVRHRQFQNPQPSASGPHLHLEVPAIGHLAHVEAVENVGADCTESAHVAVFDAVQKTDRGADYSAGERLVKSNAVGLGSATRARADHEIVFVREYRLDEGRDRLWPVAAVAVEEHENFRPGCSRCL